MDKLFTELNLSSTSKYYIIAGDFNTRHTSWSNSSNSNRGNTLKNWIDENDVTYRINLLHSEFPSYPRNGSFIDLFLADARINFQNAAHNKLETIPFTSDHEAIAAVINISDQRLALRDIQNEHRFNFAKTNWKKFKNILSKYNPDIPSNTNISIKQIDQHLNDIKIKILETIEQTVPKFQTANSTDKYLNRKIKQLQKEEAQAIATIRSIRRTMAAGPHIRHSIHIINSRIKALRRKIKMEIDKEVNNYWFNRISKINPKQSHKMFPDINSIFRKKEPLTIPALKISAEDTDLLYGANIDPKTLHIDGNDNFWVKNNIEKLNLLGAYYSKVNDQNTEINNPKFTNIIEREYCKINTELVSKSPATLCTFNHNNSAVIPLPTDEASMHLTNLYKVEKKFKCLNSKKSAGNDNIPNIALKNLPRNTILLYTILFNNMLNHSYFPVEWKNAKTIAILKKGKDKSNPSSYRPISLLSNIGKVYERIINDALIEECHKKEIIPENQYGFRRHHSTIHAINKLASDVCWALNGHKCVGACLVDLEKAFDTVWLHGLIYKLKKKGFSLMLIKIIKNMISDRSFQTSLGKEISQINFQINNGLQQGTINSPILFNIYTSDILKLFGPDNTSCSLLAYADDLIIYRADNSPKEVQATLQIAIKKIFNYYKAWKFKVNTDKCESILFRPSCKSASYSIQKYHKNFELVGVERGEKPIINKTAVKYLGMLLDNRFLLNVHPLTQLGKAKKAFAANARIFHSRKLNTKVKIICYQALIRPIMTYGCEMWYNTGASLMERFRVFERRCLRACVGIYRSESSNFKKYIRNSIIYNRANVNRIDNFIIKLVRNYFARVSEIQNNSLIFPIAFPDENYIRNSLNSGFIPPEAFIFLDKNGYIQNSNAVPLLYHTPRHMSKKAITYQSPLKEVNLNLQRLVYNTDIPQRDQVESQRMKTDCKRYWWLADQYKPP
ncbi:uncharacterized protein LOC143174605 [Nomia melanderi]|uniref:uncharacterized protein LOC143174605 n=1 Tax=Nomia melanderi TaxID=2448451 RepID=UPI003FCE9471